MGELHDLGEARVERFRNMPPAERQRFLDHEFLASQIVLREYNVASGIWTQEQADEWGKEHDEKIAAMSSQDREAILGRVEQIRAYDQRQRELLENHNQETEE